MQALIFIVRVCNLLAYKKNEKNTELCGQLPLFHNS
jgi:hypothetical protein